MASCFDKFTAVGGTIVAGAWSMYVSTVNNYVMVKLGNYFFYDGIHGIPTPNLKKKHTGDRAEYGCCNSRVNYS